jgi:hypothetical protein
MTLLSLRKFPVYFAALAVSSIILFLAFKFATLAGPLLLLDTSRWMPFAILLFGLAIRHILRTSASWQPKPLVVKRDFLK